uniref:4Fe-4S ferredoxin-type domain-containing protein n=1 Tax=Quercus lobata TaxID=97700 RepID=A0A7N2R6C9_QUELO
MPTNMGCSGWFFRHCLWQLLNTAASLRTFRRGGCLARENQGSFFVGGTGEMHGGFDVWWAQSMLFLNQKMKGFIFDGVLSDSALFSKWLFIPSWSNHANHYGRLRCLFLTLSLAASQHSSISKDFLAPWLLVQVDCIDCAADVAVVSAVNDGIKSARDIGLRRPWVMISVNDAEDLHFRKADKQSIRVNEASDVMVLKIVQIRWTIVYFWLMQYSMNKGKPNSLIWRIVHLNVQGLVRLFVLLSLNEGNSTLEVLNGTNASKFLKGGVITGRCYGCGRCFPVCPYSNIRVVTYIRDTTATADLIKRNGIDAVEIHTSGRQTALFEELWDGLGDSIAHLRLTVCVSLPNIGDSTISSMNTMYSIMEPNLATLLQFMAVHEMKLDGDPMSRDIGRGATRESIAFAV